MQLIGKAIHPLPLDPTGRVDSGLDIKLDYRPLELRKPETRAVFKLKWHSLNYIRQFFNENDFMEINTPKILSQGAEGGATLFQLKYFNLRHLGVAPLSDVGCSYRCVRREALEKVIDNFTKQNSDELAKGINDITITLFTTKTVIENDLRVIETPITFKERKGMSKSGVTHKNKAIRYGLQLLYFLLFY